MTVDYILAVAPLAIICLALIITASAIALRNRKLTADINALLHARREDRADLALLSVKLSEKTEELEQLKRYVTYNAESILIFVGGEYDDDEPEDEGH